MQKKIQNLVGKKIGKLSDRLEMKIMQFKLISSDYLHKKSFTIKKISEFQFHFFYYDSIDELSPPDTKKKAK